MTLAFSIQIPLVNEAAAWQASGSMFGILAQPLEEYGGAIGVILAAVFGLYALVAFGFGTLLKRRSTE